jgi:hypothetical protein
MQDAKAKFVGIETLADWRLIASVHPVMAALRN